MAVEDLLNTDTSPNGISAEHQLQFTGDQRPSVTWWAKFNFEGEGPTDPVVVAEVDNSSIVKCHCFGDQCTDLRRCSHARNSRTIQSALDTGKRASSHKGLHKLLPPGLLTSASLAAYYSYYFSSAVSAAALYC